MHEHAGSEAPGAHRHEIHQGTPDEGAGVVLAVVNQHHREGHNPEHLPAMCAEGHAFKSAVLREQVAHEKPAPEELFHKWHHQCHACKPHAHDKAEP